MLLLLPQSSPVPPASSAQLQPRLVDVGFLLALVELLPVDAGHAQHVREPQPLFSQPRRACGAALQLDAPYLADALPSAGLVQPQRVPEPPQSPLDDDVLLLLQKVITVCTADGKCKRGYGHATVDCEVHVRRSWSDRVHMSGSSSSR